MIQRISTLKRHIGVPAGMTKSENVDINSGGNFAAKPPEAIVQSEEVLFLAEAQSSRLQTANLVSRSYWAGARSLLDGVMKPCDTLFGLPNGSTLLLLPLPSIFVHGLLYYFAHDIKASKSVRRVSEICAIIDYTGPAGRWVRSCSAGSPTSFDSGTTKLLCSLYFCSSFCRLRFLSSSRRYASMILSWSVREGKSRATRGERLVERLCLLSFLAYSGLMLYRSLTSGCFLPFTFRALMCAATLNSFVRNNLLTSSSKSRCHFTSKAGCSTFWHSPSIVYRKFCGTN